MNFPKVQAGWYATKDGTAAVIVDCTADREWGAVVDDRGRLREDKDVGETLGWYPTAREALLALKDHYGRTAS